MREDRQIGTRARLRSEFAVSLGILAVVALLPAFVTNDYWRGVVIVSMYFAMLAAAWNLLAGYTGQFSLAPATFGMIGAYTTGLFAYHLGAPPLVGIPAAIVLWFATGIWVLYRIIRGWLALTSQKKVP